MRIEIKVHHQICPTNYFFATLPPPPPPSCPPVAMETQNNRNFHKKISLERL